METMERLFNDERPRRLEYSAAFKVSVLEQTCQPGASVSGVALQHGLHPNMVHRWLREQRLQAVTPQLQAAAPAFAALPLPSAAGDASSPASPLAQPPQTASCETIRIEKCSVALPP